MQSGMNRFNAIRSNGGHEVKERILSKQVHGNKIYCVAQMTKMLHLFIPFFLTHYINELRDGKAKVDQHHV